MIIIFVNASQLRMKKGYKRNGFVQIFIKLVSGFTTEKITKMKIACIGIFSSVASYTISAVSHRSALKKSLINAAIRQPSMTNAEMMQEWAEKLPENFWKTGRFAIQKKKSSVNRKRSSRFSCFQKYHRRNRF